MPSASGCRSHTARAVSSGVEHVLHTDGVAGSKPAPPTKNQQLSAAPLCWCEKRMKRRREVAFVASVHRPHPNALPRGAYFSVRVFGAGAVPFAGSHRPCARRRRVVSSSPCTSRCQRTLNRPRRGMPRLQLRSSVGTTSNRGFQTRSAAVALSVERVTTPTEFFRWWIIDDRTGKRARCATCRIQRERSAIRARPG